MAIEKKISEVELLNEITLDVNIVAEQEGSWKRLNPDTLLPSKKDAEFENSLSMGRSYEIGEKSIALGQSVGAISPRSTALGYATRSGAKGYYIKSIDTVNKKIYLSREQVLFPEISQVDNTDESIDVTAYADSNEYIFTIVNRIPYTNYLNPDGIYANVITYINDFEFTEIDTTSSNSNDFSFIVNDMTYWGEVIFGKNNHAIGYGNKSYGENSNAEGKETVASGNGSHSEGRSTIASGNYTHTEGYQTKAIGLQSHSEGLKSQSIGNGTHAEGFTTKAIGEYSHTEGNQTVSNDKYAHAEGARTNANGAASHAEGIDTIAGSQGAHAEGYKTTANGLNSHTEGIATITTQRGAHAEGNNTQAKAQCAHVEGYYTLASSINQHVQGKFNIEDTENTYAHIVGGGTSNTPSNLHTIRWNNGQGFFKGGTTTEGADYAEYFEWLDGNLNNEDRVGLLVTLNGDKIILANSGDEIIGIISGTAAVLGDNYECEWNGKYLTDNFGRIQYEEVEEFDEIHNIIIDDESNITESTETVSLGFFQHPKLNPEYDPEQAYVNRANRPEWDAVGMLGKLFVRDDGTCQINGYVTVGENGIATKSDEKTNMRVLSRVNDNVIRVLLK